MHSYNSIFASDKFRLEYDNKHQEQYFSGFGAQNQNARSETTIQIIMYTEIIFMVHSSLNWTYYGENEIYLW